MLGLRGLPYGNKDIKKGYHLGECYIVDAGENTDFVACDKCQALIDADEKYRAWLYGKQLDNGLHDGLYHQADKLVWTASEMKGLLFRLPDVFEAPNLSVDDFIVYDWGNYYPGREVNAGTFVNYLGYERKSATFKEGTLTRVDGDHSGWRYKGYSILYDLDEEWALNKDMTLKEAMKLIDEKTK